MTPNRFHNTSTADLADQIGRLDSHIKAKGDELDEMKGEFRRRGVNVARGADFVVSTSTSKSSRLDTGRLKADLGDAIDDYYVQSETTRILIKPAPKLAEDAA